MARQKDGDGRYSVRRERRGEPDEGDRLHLAKRFEAALHAAEVARGFLLIVAAQAWPHSKVSNTIDIEAGIRTQRSDAVNQESGADHQHDRDSDLRDEERRPQA